MKKMIITVSGEAGSGKSTISKKLAEKLGLEHLSAGKIFREIAEKRKMSLLQLHKLAEENREIDEEVDGKIRKEASKGNVIVEGRLTGWILREKALLKIFLKAPKEERALRIARRDNKTMEEALKDIEEREESNLKRYKEHYGIDAKDLEIYDIIINTSQWDVDKIVELLEKAIKNMRK